MMTPRWMKPSIGLISVCGQFASRPACSFRPPAIAVRSSHSARRCGSSASDFTVRMPCTVSTIVEPLLLSATVSLPMIRRSAGRNSRMTPVITRGADQHDPGQRRLHPEQERQQEHQREHVEERAHQLAGQELAHLPDLRDAVVDLAGRVLLEIVERQAEQPVEHVQVEPRIDPGGHDLDQLAPREAEQRLIERW